MKRRGLFPDERVLWSAVTRSIAPMRAVAPAPSKHATKARVSRPPAQVPAPPPLSPLGRRMRSRVARGKEDIDGRLDLHGLTQSEAHVALLRFLRQAGGRGARLVLVITGKGARGEEGERGVLRRQVPQWLRLPEFRALVIGFEQAHVAHGGEGALYVRVRRARA